MSKDKPHYLPDGKLYKGDTHKVGSTLMTGAKHSASSKVLTHTGEHLLFNVAPGSGLLSHDVASRGNGFSAGSGL